MLPRVLVATPVIVTHCHWHSWGPPFLFSLQFEIFVRSPSGTPFTLVVEPSDTVDYVRATIQDRLGIPPDMQRLVCGTRQLEDGRTISEYGVQHWSTIHVQLRLFGGMQIVAESLPGKLLVIKCFSLLWTKT
jgi:ubiquitin C